MAVSQPENVFSRERTGLELRTVIQKVRICYVMQKRSTTMRARMVRIGSQTSEETVLTYTYIDISTIGDCTHLCECIAGCGSKKSVCHSISVVPPAHSPRM
eukprot:scaffold6264_cov88-Skeletonema_dohrnii-CCMP3373.AAC.1